MIDLRTDSVTQPTGQMREAAKNAETGHDGLGDDPTVTRLQETAATKLEMGAGLYLPSGTMANQIAARTHTETGAEVMVESESHIYNREVAGLTQLSGLHPRPIDGGERGIPDSTQISEAIRDGDIHETCTGLLALENTHNRKGGIALTPEELSQAAEIAHVRGIPVHLDGARLFRAAATLDAPVTEFTDPVDSVYVDLAKIGAPVGVILAGDAKFIERCRKTRQLFGGHMKQSGIIAAPAMEALDDTERLSLDNEKATRLADGIRDVPRLDVNQPETNIVIIRTEALGVTATEFVERLESAGIYGITLDDYRVRFCTHRDVSSDEISAAVARLRDVVEGTT